ncbi:deoxyribonuclease IV [Thermodesulfobacteriota bacterium]
MLGAHWSIAKGLHHALQTAHVYGCNALQIFTKNATAWKERTLSPEEIALFQQTKVQTGIGIIAAHTSYLINLASIEKEKYAKACGALKQELARASLLGIPFVVHHPGSHKGIGDAEGINRITDSINSIFSDTPGSGVILLLETTAGQGSSVGHTFEQLAAIIDKIEKKARVGVCLDSSHIFAAGYDIRKKAVYGNTINAFEAVIGLKNLHLIHLNDSKTMFGSRVDRHEHIGRGYIGLEAFRCFMNDKRFRNIAKIIETPKKKKGKDWDKVNLKLLRSLVKQHTTRPVLRG